MVKGSKVEAENQIKCGAIEFLHNIFCRKRSNVQPLQHSVPSSDLSNDSRKHTNTWLFKYVDIMVNNH